MKKILMTLALFATTSAFAKMTVYSNAAALQFVLADSETMMKVYDQVKSVDLTSAQISSKGQGPAKKFTVRLTFTTETPIGNRSCYTDVALASKSDVVELPSGAKIAVNNLAVTKISKNICEK